MNLAKAVDCGISCASAGGIIGIFCEFLSLFLPFYHVHLAAASCFGAGFAVGVCYAVYRRADMRHAAKRLDSFGLKERVLTAYENLDREDAFALLQRQDARFHYDKIRGEIKIPLLPDRRHILALLAALAVAAGVGFIPSPVREQAALRHQVKQQAEAEKEELEALLDALERVDMESLSEEQRVKLRELLDTMELSRENLAEADSPESLSAARDRLDYKYQQAAQSLEQLSNQMEFPEAAGIASAEAFARAATDGNSQQMVSPGAQGGSDGEGDGPRDGDAQDGEIGSGDEKGGGGKGNSGDGIGKGGEGDSGGGNGQEAGGQNGENGSGSGNGSGNGNGYGRGTGSSDTAHDYVSIPNAVGDDSSLTGNKTGDQHSDYYRQQNGLAWEGDHVDYSAVIGEYADSAYEGIANGRYPSGMESVIRDYFESLNK